MSIPFFHDVLSSIGKKINYESMSNLYGNSFAKKVDKYLSKLYPLKGSGSDNVSGFAKMINSSKITKISAKGKTGADIAKALGVNFDDII